MTEVINEPTLDPSAVTAVDPKAVGTSTPRAKMPTKAAIKSFNKPLRQPTTLGTGPATYLLSVDPFRVDTLLSVWGGLTWWKTWTSRAGKHGGAVREPTEQQGEIAFPSSGETFRTPHPSIERGIGRPRSIGIHLPHSLFFRWPRDKPLTCSHWLQPWGKRSPPPQPSQNRVGLKSTGHLLMSLSENQQKLAEEELRYPKRASKRQHSPLSSPSTPPLLVRELGPNRTKGLYWS